MEAAAKKYEELRRNENAYTAKLTIWESRGDNYYRQPDGTIPKFWYDVERKQIVPSAITELAHWQLEGYALIKPEVMDKKFSIEEIR